jgi:hypothetical protein
MYIAGPGWFNKSRTYADGRPVRPLRDWALVVLGLAVAFVVFGAIASLLTGFIPFVSPR